MNHIRGLRDKITMKISKAVIDEGSVGDITVVTNGTALDTQLIYLACTVGKEAKRKVSLVHVIEVPRSLPLKAVLPQESTYANALLSNAMGIAEQIGCQIIPTVIQAHEAGTAIVEEARDYKCSLLFIGWIHQEHHRPHLLNKTTLYVLLNAPCRVWLIQDIVDRSQTL
jgi:Universal stress protein family